MEVYALVGRSGTGKSHRAILVAYENSIDTVIDDGLLIKDGCKIAGKSAKREATIFAAVRRAIFHDPEHAREVRECLVEMQPARVLVLGTSLHMIKRITTVLNIPSPVRVISIEDIATEKEIGMAKELRESHGMHVVPVPAIELKADFPGYLVDPLKYFIKRKNEPRQQMGEKSIIRPKFSLIGKLLISEHTITQLVSYFVIRVAGITRVNRVIVNMQEEGVTVHLEVTAAYNLFLPDVAKEIKTNVRQQIESLTGLIVYGVHILFKSLDY